MSIKQCLGRIGNGLDYITIEPSMSLYIFAYMITTVVEQAFFVDKACRVNHGYNSSICNNITADHNTDYNKKVQVTVSEFHQWNDIAGHIVPIILALFMGAWSDKRGRKWPLLLGLAGKFYYSCMIVVNSLQSSWPVEYVIYTATLPSALTGADVAIAAACFSYLSDITTDKNRTFRITILEVSYLATMPTGIALGSYLFTKVTNRSYSILFSINATLLLTSILYTCWRVKSRTGENQHPLSETDNIITDFFDWNHVKETSKTITKKRVGKRRLYLLLLIIAMGLYTFQRDERQMSYLYFQLKLKWVFEKISTFRTYQSALQDIMLLVAVPFMSKLLNWRDTVIAMIGAIFHSIARLCYANSEIEWVIYLGGTFASLGPVVAPVIRSMVSKLVSSTERGKALSMLSVADNAIPLVSGTLYNQVYKRTLHSFPASIFYLTLITQVLVLIIFIFIHYSSTEKTVSYEGDIDKTLSTEQVEQHSDDMK